jgi:hypothetical protein
MRPHGEVPSTQDGFLRREAGWPAFHAGGVSWKSAQAGRRADIAIRSLQSC